MAIETAARVGFSHGLLPAMAAATLSVGRAARASKPERAAEKCRAAGMDDGEAQPVELQTLQPVADKWLPAAGAPVGTGRQSMTTPRIEAPLSVERVTGLAVEPAVPTTPVAGDPAPEAVLPRKLADHPARILPWTRSVAAAVASVARKQESAAQPSAPAGRATGSNGTVWSAVAGRDALLSRSASTED